MIQVKEYENYTLKSHISANQKSAPQNTKHVLFRRTLYQYKNVISK